MPETKKIADLLAEGEQPWGPLDSATYEALAADIRANKGRLVVPVVLSARGRLIDGHHRLMVAQEYGRKTINETEWVTDRNAKDPETEVLAAIKYQQNRRQTSTEDSAAVARQLMRRFGWSQGTVAAKLGVSAAAVSQWLKAHPDPTFEVTERTGQDGKTYTVPDGPPKPKTIREPAPAGAEVMRRSNSYLAQLADPEFASWVVANADLGNYPQLPEVWHAIAEAAAKLAGLLEGADHAGSEGDF